MCAVSYHQHVPRDNPARRDRQSTFLTVDVAVFAACPHIDTFALGIMLVIVLDCKLNQTVVEFSTMKHPGLVAILLFDVGVLVVSHCVQAACVQYGHTVVLDSFGLGKACV